MLSNKDIINELGRNIYVYPLAEQNIKGASINLTASSMAWSVTTKESIVTDSQIVIPARDTALIETNEIIWVSNKIAGTYHSRVRNASSGLGHISTTLNPEWIGRSLIAVHNFTDNPIIIGVNAPFVTLIFYYLNSKSTIPDTNDAARTDILQDYKLSKYEKKQIYETDHNKIPKKLKAKMIESKSYKAIRPTRWRGILKWAIYLVIVITFSIILLQIDKTSNLYDIISWFFIAYLAFMFIELSILIKSKR